MKICHQIFYRHWPNCQHSSHICVVLCTICSPWEHGLSRMTGRMYLLKSYWVCLASSRHKPGWAILPLLCGLLWGQITSLDLTWPYQDQLICVAVRAWWENVKSHFDGLTQDCSNSSALAMELLQSCTKPSALWWIDIELRIKYYLGSFGLNSFPN